MMPYFDMLFFGRSILLRKSLIILKFDFAFIKLGLMNKDYEHIKEKYILNAT